MLGRDRSQRFSSVPDIVSCCACRRETYVGLAACPHCGADMSGVQPATPEPAKPASRWVRVTDQSVVILPHKPRLVVYYLGMLGLTAVLVWWLEQMTFGWGAAIVFAAVVLSIIGTERYGLILFGRRPLMILEPRGVVMPNHFQTGIPWSTLYGMKSYRARLLPQAHGFAYLLQPKYDHLMLDLIEDLDMRPVGLKRHVPAHRKPTSDVRVITAGSWPIRGDALCDLILEHQRKWYGKRPKRLRTPSPSKTARRKADQPLPLIDAATREGLVAAAILSGIPLVFLICYFLWSLVT